MKTVIRSPEISASKKILEYERELTKPMINNDEEFKEFIIDGYEVNLLNEKKLTSQELVSELQELRTKNKCLEEDFLSLQSKYENLTETIEAQRHTAKKNAYKEGIVKAEEEAQARIDERLSAGEKVLDEIKNRVISDVYEQESVCLEIVYSAICRLVGESVGSKQQIKEILKLSIEKVASQDNLDIYISEHDYDALIDDEFVVGNFIKSDEIDHGGCIIKTGHGSVEAKLDKQLFKLKELLLNVHKVQQS